MRIVLVALSLALTWGCGDPPEPKAEGAEPAAAPRSAPEPAAEPTASSPTDAEPPEPPPAPAGFMPVPPAFDALALTARLPADAMGLLAVGSPAVLARRVGWSGLLDALGPQMSGDRAALKQTLGHDLFDPDAWAGLGVDPQRPAGVAVLSIDPPIVAVTVSLADHEALRTALLALAASGVELKQSTEGGLHLLYDDRVAFGVREGEGWLVLGDRLHPGEALHHARALAAAPAETLIARPKVAAAIARLNYGREAAAIVNLPAIFDALMRQAMKTAPHARLERRLRGAEALGDAEAIAAAREALEAARSRGPGVEAGSVAAGMMLRSYLSPFGGLAVGANVDGGQVQLRFAHILDRASPVGAIFSSRTGPLPLRAAFARPPAGLVELNVDPGAVLELGRALGTLWVGGALGPLDRDLSAATGRDLGGLTKLWAGDVGAAAEVEPERVIGARSVDELVQRVRFAGHLGLTDPAGAAAVLDRLTALPDGRLAAVDGPPDGPRTWRLGLDPRTTLWLAIAGPQLYATLDEGTLKRLASAGDPGAGFVADLPAAPRAMLDGTDGGWSGWLDIAGLGPLMLDGTPGVVLEPPPPGDDPRTALETRLAAISRQIDDTHRAHRQGQIERGRVMLAALGTLAASVRPVDGGLDGRAGLYVGAATVAEAVAGFARGVAADEAASRAVWNDTLPPLYDERRALQRQLDALDGAPEPR